MKPTTGSIAVFLAAVCALCAALASHPAEAAGTSIRVRSEPSGAKVYINGYFKGRTPATVRVASASATAKTYKVTLIKPGYEKWTGSVTLKRGDTKSVAATMSKGGTPLTSNGSLRGKTICLDPGHPSEVSEGAVGPNGVTEKHINWVVAQKLKSLLAADGAKVVLTKSSENQRVSNRQRAEIANEAGASLMLRLHCDSGPIDGAATYYPDKQGHKDGVQGPSESILRRSKGAANGFHPSFAAALQPHIKDRGVHGDSATLVGSQQGALTGSIFAKIPVLTVEMCVLSSAHDEAFIRTESGQARMARALEAGIRASLGR